VLAKRENGRTGTILGRKGAQTRARLLAATRELLQTVSPFQLTVVAIAKAAQTASATLYVYFDDVEHVLYELCEEACHEFSEMLARHPGWFTDRENIAEHVERFIEEYNRVWDRHSHVLLYRNLEADRGNLRFLDVRTLTAMPIVHLLAAAIQAARPGLTELQAQSDAIVLYSAVERLAGTRRNYATMGRGMPFDELMQAQIRVIIGHLVLPS